jgi:hypothetical protein
MASAPSVSSSWHLEDTVISKEAHSPVQIVRIERVAQFDELYLDVGHVDSTP